MFIHLVKKNKKTPQKNNKIQLLHFMTPSSCWRFEPSNPNILFFALEQQKTLYNCFHSLSSTPHDYWPLCKKFILQHTLDLWISFCYVTCLIISLQHITIYCTSAATPQNEWKHSNICYILNMRPCFVAPLFNKYKTDKQKTRFQ